MVSVRRVRAEQPADLDGPSTPQGLMWWVEGVPEVAGGPAGESGDVAAVKVRAGLEGREIQPGEVLATLGPVPGEIEAA